MKSFTAAALTRLATAVPTMAGSGFCYDENTECGPSNWGTLQIDGNQCDGTKNSPIAIEDTGCTMYLDYDFQVCFSNGRNDRFVCLLYTEMRYKPGMYSGLLRVRLIVREREGEGE